MPHETKKLGSGDIKSVRETRGYRARRNFTRINSRKVSLSTDILLDGSGNLKEF